MADRVNLVKNPSFEASSADWAATGASVTIARYTSDGYSGTSSLQVTKKATTDCGAVVSARIPVTADLKYTLSAYVKVPSGEETSSLRVNIEWYTAEVSGSYIYMDSSTAVSITDSLGWTRIYGTFRAPATAVAAVVSVTQPSAGTADETFLIDAVLLEQADKLNRYIDLTERVNLTVNPSFKTDTTGWSTNSSGIERITTDYFYGSACLRVTKQNAANSGIKSSARIRVLPSTAYALSAHVKVPVGSDAAGLAVQVIWYSQPTGGSALSTSTGTVSTITEDDEWVRIGGMFTSNASATYAELYVIQPSAGDNGEKFLVDAILFEQSSYIGVYIDEPTQAEETAATIQGFRPVPYPYTTGMKLQGDVMLGSMVLNSIDENKVVWVCTDINGWWTIADPEIEDIPRGYSDGSYIARGRYSSRKLELTGTFFPPDRTYVPAARDKLLDAVNLVYSGAWLIVNENPPKASYVRISGRPEIQTVNVRGRTEFSVGLVAGDPIKYEWSAERYDGYKTLTIPCKSGSPVEDGVDTITNSGNATVSAIFEITGPITGPATITNNTTGDVLEIISSFTSDYKLEIDTYNRTVTRVTIATGVRTTSGIRSYVDTLTDWLTLAPGENEIEFEDSGAANSTASLTVYYRSGWVG